MSYLFCFCFFTFLILVSQRPHFRFILEFQISFYIEKEVKLPQVIKHSISLSPPYFRINGYILGYLL